MLRFKKLVATLMAVTMMLSVSAVSVYADDDDVVRVSGNFKYTIDEDDGVVEVEIKKYIGSASNVTIPDTIRGYKVKSVDEKAFRNNTKVKVITIGKNVTEIDEGAFAGTRKLKKFTVKSGNRRYKTKAGVLVKKSNSYIVAYPEGKGAKYTVPAGIKGIEDEAFKKNKTLKKIVIKNSVKVIDEEAFKNCVNLTSVTLGNKLKKIKDDAFLGCKKLKAVTVPKGVVEIEDEAFGYINDYRRVSGFTVKGTRYSEAYEYAQENNFKFVAK